MTIVAWDGKTLAADKAATSVGFRTTVTKIHRIEGYLVACSGSENEAMDFFYWFRSGRVPEDFPKSMAGEGSNTDAYTVHPDGTIRRYFKGPNPATIEDKVFAFGSGRDYALAAMYLGKNARDAVELACHFDIFCGNGIDTLEL